MDPQEGGCRVPPPHGSIPGSCSHGPGPRWLHRSSSLQLLRSLSPRAGTQFAGPETEPLTFAALGQYLDCNGQYAFGGRIYQLSFTYLVTEICEHGPFGKQTRNEFQTVPPRFQEGKKVFLGAWATCGFARVLQKRLALSLRTVLHASFEVGFQLLHLVSLCASDNTIAAEHKWILLKLSQMYVSKRVSLEDATLVMETLRKVFFRTLALVCCDVFWTLAWISTLHV